MISYGFRVKILKTKKFHEYNFIINKKSQNFFALFLKMKYNNFVKYFIIPKIMENYQEFTDNNEKNEIIDSNNHKEINYISIVEELKNCERNELIEVLKAETIPPIDGVKDMKKIPESDLMIEVSSFSEKIEENTKKWNWDEILCSWEEIKQIKIKPNEIMRDNIKLQDIKWNQTRNEIFENNPEILNNKKLESFKTDEEFIDEVKWYFERFWEEITLNYKHKEIISRNTIKNAINDGKEANLRAQLYRLFSENDKLYQEFLDRIWASKGFILWVEDRWLRWWTESWGIHMWVDYNLPKGTPVNSIYEWKVVAIWTKEWIKKDPNVKRNDEIEQYFKDHEEDRDMWSLWSMMVIQHQIWWKTFYSYYLHITPNREIWDEIEKGEEVWKLAGYDTNGHWQPHLHFTIMRDMTYPILRGYLNKNSITESEKTEYWVVCIDKELKKNPGLSDQEKEELQEKLQEQNTKAYEKLYNDKYSKDMINPMEIYN